jgi:hypothetical protein
LVGALWGLIDLQDERAADALLELLTQGRRFYELFGFLSRAGDRRAIIPLLQLAMGADCAAAAPDTALNGNQTGRSTVYS